MSISTVPFLRSGTDDFNLTLRKEGSAMVAEAFRTAPILANDSQAILRKVESSGTTSVFFRKAWTPRPDIAMEFGSRLQGSAYGFQQIEIKLDDRPISLAHYIPKHLRRISEFEPFRPVVQGAVDETMREIDRRAFLALHKASRQTTAPTDSNGNLTLHNGANRVQVTNASSVYGTSGAFPTTANGGAALRAQIDNLRLLARQRDLPEDGAKLYITPSAAAALQQDPTLFDQRYAQDRSVNNMQRSAIGMIANFDIYVVPGTDRMRNTNINSASGATGYPSKYWGNYSHGTNASGAGEPVAVAVFRGPEGTAPVGMRQVGPIDVETDYLIEYQSDMVVVSAHIGFDPLDTYLVGSIEVITA